MSRRKDKAAETAAAEWDGFVSRQYVGGGEEYHFSHEGMASEAGLEYLDYVTRYDDGSEHVDEEAIERDALARVGPEQESESAATVPLAFLEVRCNKCDHRIDVVSFVRPSLTEAALARSRYASGMRIIVGESPRGFTKDGLRYACRRCARTGLLVSMSRINRFFTSADEAAPMGTRPSAPQRQVVRV